MMDIALLLPNAEKYWCQIYHYNLGHSELSIHLVYETENYYLHFSGVRYFCGPMIWQGANFQLASAEQCLELVRRIRKSVQIPDEMIPEVFQLYSMKLGTSQVDILCHRMDLSKTPPQ